MYSPFCAQMRGFMGEGLAGERFGKGAANGRRRQGRSIDSAGIMRYNESILEKFFLLKEVYMNQQKKCGGYNENVQTRYYRLRQYGKYTF